MTPLPLRSTPLLLLLLLLLVGLLPRGAGALVPERSRRRRAGATTTTTSSSSSPLFAARRRYRSFDDGGGDHHPAGSGGGDVLRSPKRSGDRPTQTMTQIPDPLGYPEKPKIVVLGASGQIGRRVVRQLVESQIDATIVAFCRDYDKACRVLYDDVLVVSSRRRDRGPKLQIVQGDLVPPEELPGFDDGAGESEEEEEEIDWRGRAESAAKFYGTDAEDYDNRAATSSSVDGGGDDDEEPGAAGDCNEALEDAVRGCTTIISCVGSVRPTNIWTDILARPFLRLLRHDVSDWCNDRRHPYYVNYLSTRKALAFAEREQLRREAAAAEAAAASAAEKAAQRREEEDSNDDAEHGGGDELHVLHRVPRIRIVRISDLCVSQRPWNLVPVLTNALHSMVFRYQDMAERILEASSVVETVVLRPGDLVNAKRDADAATIQLSVDGRVPSPSIIGRDDVAALAVAAAMFDTSVLSERSERGRVATTVGINPQQREEREPAFHYTLAARWAGQKLGGPYPPQGTMGDGLPTAQLAMQSALRKIRRREKQLRRRYQWRQNRAARSASSSSSSVASASEKYRSVVQHFARKLPTANRQRLKPYGICVAVPIYLVLTMVTRAAISAVIPLLPSGRVSTWMTNNPLGQQVSKLSAALGAFVVSQWNTLVQQGAHVPPKLRALFAWLPRLGSRKYINI